MELRQGRNVEGAWDRTRDLGFRRSRSVAPIPLTHPLILIASIDLETVTHVKAELGSIFTVRDLGEAKFFLGMEITRLEDGSIKLSQARAIRDLVSKFGMSDAHVKSTPMSTSTRLTKGGSKEVDKSTVPYMELVGSLLYLASCTRPDISQAVGALSRYMAHPTEHHWSTAKGVLRYLAGTPELGIVFNASGAASLHGYCDADYAGDIDTRRSTTGYMFLLAGGAISWSSKLQPTVAVSTAEAEYMAAAHAVKEALWLRKVLCAFELGSREPVPILCDNQAALKLLVNPIVSSRSKHIDVLHHFARERVLRREVEFSYCPTDRMIADSFTKAVPEHKFRSCCTGMGLAV